MDSRQADSLSESLTDGRLRINGIRTTLKTPGEHVIHMFSGRIRFGDQNERYDRVHSLPPIEFARTRRALPSEADEVAWIPHIWGGLHPSSTASGPPFPPGGRLSGPPAGVGFPFEGRGGSQWRRVAVKHAAPRNIAVAIFPM